MPKVQKKNGSGRLVGGSAGALTTWLYYTSGARPNASIGDAHNAAEVTVSVGDPIRMKAQA